MAVAVGVDVAKDFHWAAVELVDTGKLLLSRRVDNDPDSIGELVSELLQVQTEHGPVTVAIDLMGGVASLLTTMLLEAGIRLVHVPGLVVNRARRATRGGEHKSDPRDAKVIADQLRLRQDWRELDFTDDISLDLRLLVGRRRGSVVEQTRRLVRLRDTAGQHLPRARTRLGRHQPHRPDPAHPLRDPGGDTTSRQPSLDRLPAAPGRPATVRREAGRRGDHRRQAQQRSRFPVEDRTAEFVRELASEALTARDASPNSTRADRRRSRRPP